VSDRHALTGEPLRRIRTIVVDDEAPARSNLTVLVRRDPELELAGEFGSGEEALAGIRALQPELVFLDVEMPECDGFDVLASLGAKLPPAIVFVTAYDAYAVRAFEAGALDYLLKPFDDVRFDRTLARAKLRIAQTQPVQRAMPPLLVRGAGRITFITLAEIDWIESADYYSRVHVGPESHLVRRSLNEFERDLDPAIFCRIHRTAIVRLDRIRGLEINAAGEYDVLMTDGTRLPLSRRNRKTLGEHLHRKAAGGSSAL
jgi:two-component system LytT family response regulator